MKKRRKPDVFGTWISVEERLPKPGKSCLVYSPHSITPMSSDQRSGRYADPWEFHCRGDVTHWMPLPKPPKKGRKHGKA